MRGCSFLQLTISSRECADKKHNAISQSAVSCAILQFFADLCKQKENRLVKLKFITHLAIIYMVGKQMKRVLAQKCYRHILASNQHQFETIRTNGHFFECGDVEDLFSEENIFPFYQL